MPKETLMDRITSRSGQHLAKRIAEREAMVGIIGLGYVGLPLLLSFAKNGFRATGFDIDPSKIRQLETGRSYISHIDDEEIANLLESGRLNATNDFAALGAMHAILICVPTPLDKARNPDLSYVERTGRAVARGLKPGQLVVLESTTYPGTTREILKPILEKSGYRSGRDFFLAFSPEREDPGNIDFNLSAIPKVVGGDGDEACALTEALYEPIVSKTVPVSSADTAEAVKLTENIFRAVNIALVNELKMTYARMGIDIWEVIEAAKTKPFGFMPFYPGPGFGGHCIPIDPFYLAWKARIHGTYTKFIELAGEINTTMPEYVVGVLIDALNEHLGRSLREARLLIVGIAYKKNVNDMRESPALPLIEAVHRRGGNVEYHDPEIPVIPRTRHFNHLAGRKSIEWNAETLAGYDAAIICTDHDTIDWSVLAEHCPLIVDTRNAMAGVPNPKAAIVPA